MKTIDENKTKKKTKTERQKRTKGDRSYNERVRAK